MAAFTVSAPVLKAAAAVSAGRARQARRSVAVRAAAFEMPAQYKKVRVRDKASPDPTRSATATSGFPPAKEPSEKASLVDKAKVCKSSSTHPRADVHPVSPPQISPVGTQVLVKVAEAEKTTAGGIILAESAQRKPTSGASPDASDDDLSRPKPCATSTLKRPRDGVCASKFWRRVFQVSEASSRRRALKTLPLGAPSSPSSSR